ncbi:acid type B receptor subunit 2 [Seminavis robusta]|uniref:Acid type B receptor subunit 2 n=1 Tax=Seminavis robusta TaxID=568900 RepID=A0A9N8DPM3_9STRA|nr:acid type B receptor subunit 2 [Seminavis robusta]|eukprot:Sro267_g103310.1 acid type B receptor subunit 2 (938) ;mRNA; f:10728-13639
MMETRFLLMVLFSTATILVMVAVGSGTASHGSSELEAPPLRNGVGKEFGITFRGRGHHSTRLIPSLSAAKREASFSKGEKHHLRRKAVEMIVMGGGQPGAEEPTSQLLTFALIPKLMNNPFFDVSGEGCHDTAERLGVACLYIGPPEFDSSGALQVALLEELLRNHTTGVLPLAGLAISSVNAESLEPVIAKATSLKIPVVTFDSDAPQTDRLAYIGTDNYFLGTQLAKTLKQIQPSRPGTFGIVSGLSPNLVEREQGVRDHLVKEGWIEVGTSPADHNASSTTVVDKMFGFVEQHSPTAIIPVMGAGMRAPDNYWQKFAKTHPEVLLVVGDAMPNQLELLDRQFCDGLVGQLPYEMGALSIETLLKFSEDPNYETDEFIGTNVLEHLLIPLILPEHVVDHNLVGQLRYVGYTLFAIVAILALGFSTWTWVHRNVRVVMVSQPKFLVMVALGVLIMISAVLPMGFDDYYETNNESNQYTNTSDESSSRRGVAMCMTPVWLLTLGFSLIFSSLVSKIYRVHKLFQRATRFSHLPTREWDSLIPLIALLVANCTILISWTVVDPLRYVRVEHDGTDGWDRPVSTYGMCQCNKTVAFLVPLCIVNGLVLVFANWVAYKARSINEEFAESKYIAVTMASMLQAFLSGVPILVVVQESPQAFYMVSVFMIFITCSVILLLIFVPKIVLYQHFSSQPEHVQRSQITQSIRSSVKQRPLRSSLKQHNGPSYVSSLDDSFSNRPQEAALFVLPSILEPDHDDSFSAAVSEQALSLASSKIQKKARFSEETIQADMKKRPTDILRSVSQNTDSWGGASLSGCEPIPSSPITSKKSVDVLQKTTSWGGVNLSLATKDDSYSNRSTEDFHDEADCPGPNQKPVDVLKGGTSWGGAHLSTLDDCHSISNGEEDDFCDESGNDTTEPEPNSAGDGSATVEGSEGKGGMGA